jgi:hypothetical protein
MDFEVSSDAYETMRLRAFGNQLEAKTENLVKFLNGLIHAGLGTESEKDHKCDLPQIDITVSEYDLCQIGAETHFEINEIIAWSCLDIIGVADALNLKDETVSSETDVVGLSERFENAVNLLLRDFDIVPVSRANNGYNCSSPTVEAA